MRDGLFPFYGHDNKTKAKITCDFVFQFSKGTMRNNILCMAIILERRKTSIVEVSEN